MSRNIYISCVGALLAWTAAVGAFGKPKQFSDLPPTVRHTMKTEADAGWVSGISTERHHGKTVYEAEFEQNGHYKTMSVDETGSLLEIDNHLDLDDLPGHIEFSADRAKQFANLARVVYRNTSEAIRSQR